jgi:PQQ-dependent catabolism-associated CXXCW motif protein
MIRTTHGLLLAGAVLMAIGVPAAAQDSFGATQRPATASPTARPVAPPPTTLAGELQDFGVPPTNRLHDGAMHGPTPVSIPGGKVVTTSQVAELLRSGADRYLLLDVLGGPERLPNALPAAWLAQPGSFDDAVQRQAAGAFQQATGGRKEAPIVLYCQSVHCWMSYNAALRAIAAGYSNVLWYRGGIEAWKAAGMPVQAAGAGSPVSGTRD